MIPFPKPPLLLALLALAFGPPNLLADVAGAWTDLLAGESLAARWAKVNGDPPSENWKLADGVLTRSGRAGDLRTKESYQDFVLEAEWKISEGGNSGIKYRTRGNKGLEYQILDDRKHPDRLLKSHQAASLYDLVAAPKKKPLKAPGEWNQARIVARDKHIEHWLNGEKVVAIEIGSAEWKECFGTSKYRKLNGFGTWTGPILLQDHGNEVSFRKLRIRRLK